MANWTATSINALEPYVTFNSGSYLGLDTSGGNATYSGGVSLPAGATLAKVGPNTLFFTAANPYSGNILINAGTLNFAANALPSTVGGIIFGGGALQWASNNTQDVSGYIAPIASGQTANIDTNNNNVTFGSALSGTGGLTKVGAGALVLAASNTYQGTTTVSVGSLQLGDGVSNNGSVNGNITDNATLVLANPNAQTYSGQISGSGSVTMSGPGPLTLAGATTLTGGGALTVNNGTLNVNGATNVAGNLIANGGYSSFTGTTTISGSVRVNGGTLSLGGVNNLNGYWNTAYGGELILAGTTNSPGNRLQLLGGLANFSSDGAVPGGELDFEGPTNPGNPGNANAGTLQVGAQGATLNRSIYVQNGATSVTFDSQAYNSTFYGSINDGVSGGTMTFNTQATMNVAANFNPSGGFANTVLVKTGTGLLSISGPTNIGGNDLYINATAGGGTADINFTGPITGTGGGNNNGLVNIGNGIVTLSGSNNLGSDWIYQQNGTLNLAGTASTTGRLYITGGLVNFTSSAAVPSGECDFVGPTSGTIQAGAEGASLVRSPWLIENGDNSVTFDGQGYDATFGGAITSYVTGGTMVFNTQKNVTLTGTLNAGNNNIIAKTGTGLLTVSATTNIGGGNFYINANAGGGTADINFSGPIIGTGGYLLNYSSGIVVLSGSNNFSSNGQINQYSGILALTGTNSAKRAQIYGGILSFNSDAAVPGSELDFSAGSGTLQVAAQGVTMTRPVYFEGGTSATIDSQAYNSTFSGSINDWVGNSTMTFNTQGNVTLSGGLNPSAGDVIAKTGAGVLTISSTTTTPNGNMSFNPVAGGGPADISITGPITGPGNLIFNGPGITSIANSTNISGGITVNNGYTSMSGTSIIGNGLNVAAGTLNLGGTNNVSGGNSPYEGTSGGVLILSGTSTSTNRVQNLGGLVNVQSAGALPGGPSGEIDLDSSGTLQMGGANINLANNIFMQANNNIAPVIDCQAYNTTFSGPISNWISGGSLTVNTQANATLSGTISGLNATNFAIAKTGSGVLTLSGTTTTPGGANMTFSASAGGGPVDINVTGPIQGNGNVIYNGPGVMLLASTNTYTGQTTVYGGTLGVNGKINSTQTCTVSGGVLSGTGSIAGLLVVQNTAALSPGFASGVGTLNAQGGLFLNPGAILNYTLDATPSNCSFLNVTRRQHQLGGDRRRRQPCRLPRRHALPGDLSIDELQHDQRLSRRLGVFRWREAFFRGQRHVHVPRHGEHD